MFKRKGVSRFKAYSFVPSMWILLAGTGCATTPCANLGEASAVLSYTSGGDFPWGQDLQIHEAGLVLGEAGKKNRCRPLPPDEAAALLQALRESVGELANATVAAGGNADWEEVYVTYEQKTYRVLLERRSPAIGSLFERIDHAFGEKFGRRYRVRLEPD